MKNVQDIQFYPGSKKELLPDFTSDFPYIASKVEFNKDWPSVPWHWHKEIEIFYMKNGSLEYFTPKGKILFPEGFGGMVNSNILHASKAVSHTQKTIQLLHIFDTTLISGEQNSRIQKEYITPIIAAPQLEIIVLSPENPKQRDILKLIKDAFLLCNNNFGYEIQLREILSKIWMLLFEQSLSMLNKKMQRNKRNDKLKLMMIYIHEHYPEKITIAQLAAAAYLSERDCFRVFHECLHMTPVEYIKSYRLQMACQMLLKSEESITFISQSCGMGNSSYLGKLFQERMHCTPTEYRKKWQDCNI